MSDIMVFDWMDAAVAAKPPVGEVVASIPGRCTLTRQLDVNGKRREFACRIVRISPESMTVTVPVGGVVGERVIVTLMEFGRLEGPILEIKPSGFVMGINLSEADRSRFAAKVDWYDRHKNRGQPDGRRARRIVPSHPHSVVMFADGTIVGVFVIDMSVSGVAVSVDLSPRIGEPLAVGKIVGRVVRHFPGGFAVHFIDQQNAQMLEKMLLVPPAS